MQVNDVGWIPVLIDRAKELRSNHPSTGATIDGIENFWIWISAFGNPILGVGYLETW